MSYANMKGKHANVVTKGLKCNWRANTVKQ